MNKISNVLWGIVLVIVGVVFGLNALDIADINIFFDGWWTLFIIIPSIIGLFKDKDRTSNITFLIIGVCLLLACQGVLNFEIVWKLMLPFILVVLGLSIIFKDALGTKVKKEIKKNRKENSKEYCATFGKQDVSFDNEKFEGCNLSSVFGSVDCDLTDSIIKDDVVIEASAIFGAVSIHVPKDVNVKTSSIPIFGGVSDERKTKNKESQKTIYINATCLFGGVEIK